MPNFLVSYLFVLKYYNYHCHQDQSVIETDAIIIYSNHNYQEDSSTVNLCLLQYCPGALSIPEVAGGAPVTELAPLMGVL